MSAFLRAISDESFVPFVAPRPGDLPGEGTPAVAGVTLPSGHPRPDEDAFFWATDESVPDPGRFTSPLAAAFPVTGLWPLLWEWEEDPANYYWQRPTLDGIDAFSAEEVLRVACESYAEWSGSPGATADSFPGLAEPSELTQSPTADPFEAVSDDAQRESWRPPRRLLLVPCSRPADVLAVLGWDYSQIPAPLIAAVLRSWEERFAAVPVELEPSALTLHIGAPPTRIEQARKLAAEIAAIVEGPLLAGADLEGLAQTLLTGRAGARAADLPAPDLDVSPTLWRFAFREEVTDALFDLTRSERS